MNHGVIVEAAGDIYIEGPALNERNNTCDNLCHFSDKNKPDKRIGRSIAPRHDLDKSLQLICIVFGVFAVPTPGLDVGDVRRKIKIDVLISENAIFLMSFM